MADFDFAEAINSILSDPETGEKIQSLLESVSSSDSGQSNDSESGFRPDASFPDIGKLLKMKDLYDSAMKETDPHITLLASLKPYLSETRNKNLDSMMKMLKIYKVFSKVKDTSLLKELF